MMRPLAAVVAAAVFLSLAALAPAETNSMTVAKQYGVAYLPLLVMEHDQLVEKHAKQLGIGDLKVDYREFSGANVINDGLLSGAVTFAAVGPPSLITLCTKSNGAITQHQIDQRFH